MHDMRVGCVIDVPTRLLWGQDITGINCTGITILHGHSTYVVFLEDPYVYIFPRIIVWASTESTRNKCKAITVGCS